MSDIQKRKSKIGVSVGIVFIIVIVGVICFLSGFGKEESEIVVEKMQELEKTINEDKVSEVEDSKYANYVVCIDPGHGGKDPGSMTENSTEKEDNLNIALKVKKELEAYGIKVIMTRESDETQSLNKRPKIANKADADLFVSLHRNYIEGYEDINGIDVYIDSNASEQDYSLGNALYHKLSDVNEMKVNAPKRGSATDENENWIVVEKTKMPACLIELGYMSNENDNQYFVDHMDAYARAVAEGIIEYFDAGHEL